MSEISLPPILPTITAPMAQVSVVSAVRLPTELAGSWSTRDSYRLKAASVDEERSTADLVYLRLDVSYAFRDAPGRFRTEDEERLILRSDNGKIRYEGRWSK